MRDRERPGPSENQAILLAARTFFWVNFFNLAPTVKGERTLETRLEVLTQEAHIQWFVSQISFINHLYIAVVLYVQAP